MKSSEAQERMLQALRAASEDELRANPKSDGWIDVWAVLDDEVNWKAGMLGLGNVTRVMGALLRRGLVEQHPDHGELVRPASFARAQRLPVADDSTLSHLGDGSDLPTIDVRADVEPEQAAAL